LNIERSLSAIRIAAGAAALARSQIAAARETVDVNEALLQGGRISPGDLEESRSQLSQKELALLEADLALFENKVELLRITGEIISAFQ